MKKSFLFLFLFILTFPFIAATSELVFFDDFEYTSFTAAGWTYSCTGACTTGFPLDSPADMSKFTGASSFMAAFNRSMSGGVADFKKAAAWANDSNIVYTVSFDYYLNSISQLQPSYSQFIFMNGSNNVMSSIRFYYNGDVIFSDSAGVLCNLTDYASPKYNTTHHFVAYYDTTPAAPQVTIEIDSAATNCTDKALSLLANTQFTGVWIELGSAAAGTYENGFDNILVYKGYPENATHTECAYPSIFCDNFNYVIPITNNGWIPFLTSGSLDPLFAPNGKVLNLSDSYYRAPYHEIEPFPTTLQNDVGDNVVNTLLSPVFSSEFDLFMYNITDNVIDYSASRNQFQTAYLLKGIVEADGRMSWYALNNSVYKLLCANCTYSGIMQKIKINTYFSQKAVFKDFFNSSVDTDTIDFYSNNTLLGTLYNFQHPLVDFLGQYQIFKSDTSQFYIDNYRVMVGTDRNTDTSIAYYTPVFTNLSESEAITIGGSKMSGDFAPAVASLWYDMGLRSAGSRIIAGLFLMFMLAIMILAVSLQFGQPLSPAVLIVVELFFMILLTYIRLLPLWIPIVIGMVGAALAVLAAKYSAG